MTGSHETYLLLGSNLKDPEIQLKKAIQLLKKQVGVVKKKSSIYRTAAWGFTEQPDFLNQVILISTDLCAEECLAAILDIEKEMGRIRTTRNAPRLIDIDILFYDNLILDKHQLKIPHPAIPERRFVLEPMKEIASGYIHPVLNISIARLLQDCPDNLDVSKM